MLVVPERSPSEFVSAGVMSTATVKWAVTGPRSAVSAAAGRTGHGGWRLPRTERRPPVKAGGFFASIWLWDSPGFAAIQRG